MGFLKGCAKLAGSVVLGTAGVASSVLRVCASGAGMDGAADMLGKIQDKSFDTIQDMWTPEDEKTGAYYVAQMERSIERAENAASLGAQTRRELEEIKKKAGK